MRAISNTEFAERMMLLARSAKPFEGHAVYDPDGDCLEVIGKPDAFYGERVDELLTIYRSQETGDVIGALISLASESRCTS